ncbi:MAG: NAD(P)H-hydrate dehydratase [Bacteroidota bacterium]|nr:NAD(P)H-hydrate dehydratase [Bacteroidota bacterium]
MVKLFKTSQIKAIDTYTMKHEPIVSLDLMERAAENLVFWMSIEFFTDMPMLFLIGPGNNGGDGLAMARLLKKSGYDVQVCLIEIATKLSSDCEHNFNRLKEVDIVVQHIKSMDDFPEISSDTVIVDAIFGAGLSRPIHGLPAEIIHKVNSLSNRRVAIDAPSGLFGENNSENDDAIFKADDTLAIQFPSLSFLFAENAQFVGCWNKIDIDLHPDAIENTPSDWLFIERQDVLMRMKRRDIFANKGNFGHALLIAGAYQKMGAAVLAAKACLKSGVGLLTCHIPQTGYQIMQISGPEAMISIDQSDVIFSDIPDLSKYNAIGVGPGIGEKPNTLLAMNVLINQVKVPAVFDADALNIISKHPELLEKLPKNSILTPHPKEFERLFGASKNSYQELEKLTEAAKRYQLIIILKGANTRIALPDGRVLFNSTGNPGMATGGSGDVLTGMILSFLAQNYSAEDAAIIAVYLHGAAGDLYAKNYAPETLIASDLINNFGSVLNELRDIINL